MPYWWADNSVHAPCHAVIGVGGTPPRSFIQRVPKLTPRRHNCEPAPSFSTSQHELGGQNTSAKRILDRNLCQKMMMWFVKQFHNNGAASSSHLSTSALSHHTLVALKRSSKWTHLVYQYIEHFYDTTNDDFRIRHSHCLHETIPLTSSSDKTILLRSSTSFWRHSFINWWESKSYIRQ